jgi:hypothetical protein
MFEIHTSKQHNKKSKIMRNNKIYEGSEFVNKELFEYAEGISNKLKRISLGGINDIPEELKECIEFNKLIELIIDMEYLVSSYAHNIIYREELQVELLHEQLNKMKALHYAEVSVIYKGYRLIQSFYSEFNKEFKQDLLKLEYYELIKVSDQKYSQVVKILDKAINDLI